MNNRTGLYIMVLIILLMVLLNGVKIDKMLDILEPKSTISAVQP